MNATTSIGSASYDYEGLGVYKDNNTQLSCSWVLSLSLVINSTNLSSKGIKVSAKHCKSGQSALRLSFWFREQVHFFAPERGSMSNVQGLSDHELYEQTLSATIHAPMDV